MEEGSPSFPFLFLPKELRQRILFLTDLVPADRASDDAASSLHGCALEISVLGVKRSCDVVSPIPPFETCPASSSSSPDSSSSCGCGPFPRSFFLVSKQFASEAREVALHFNLLHFVTKPHNTYTFLSHLSAVELSLIRNLQLAINLNELITRDWDVFQRQLIPLLEKGLLNGKRSGTWPTLMSRVGPIMSGGTTNLMCKVRRKSCCTVADAMRDIEIFRAENRRSWLRKIQIGWYEKFVEEMRSEKIIQ